MDYAIIGQPQFINPLYAQSSETDKTLMELLFSGLMKYDTEGNPVPDLIDEYKFIENGKIIEFTLKKGVKWHDGTPLTIDDVVFTIGLVQDPSYLSPLYANWSNVEVVKTADDKGIIKLNQPYSNILDYLANLKIMPKHVWSDMPVQSIFKNEELNIVSPIGSGPYKMKNVTQDKDGRVRIMSLQANKEYYGKKAYIKDLDIFFLSENKENKNSAKIELARLLKSGAIDGAMIDNNVDYDNNKTDRYNIKNTDYFALFFNTQTKLFSSKEIRKALDLATDKQDMIDKAIKGQGYVINSPILSEYYQDAKTEHRYDIEEAKNILKGLGYEEKDGVMKKVVTKANTTQIKNTLEVGDNGAEVKKLQECLARDKDIYPDGTVNGNFGSGTKEAVIAFQEKYAEDILKPAGLDKGTGKVAGATIKKINEICFADSEESTELSVTLKVLKTPSLEATANTIKEQWNKIGVKVDIVTQDASEIKKSALKKDYDAIILGEKLYSSPELLTYWHSSQIIDPGWNLSVYQNDDLDDLLEKNRTIIDNDDKKKETLSGIEKILSEDVPAIYLYSSDYIYAFNKEVKGFALKKSVDQTKIFDSVTDWYTKEERIWKK
jgi:ABC-type transport system substrate-binding protein